jgi:uncharacterized membrane protein YoaK (UPF0700 family)
MLHLRLAASMAALGFVFTSRPWLRWLSTLSPEIGLFVKHLLILVSIVLLSSLDPSIKFVHHRQVIGVLLIYVSFVMIFNYQSDWVQDANAEDVGDQTLDGAVYHRSREVLKLSPEVSRLLTFVVVLFRQPVSHPS